MSKEEFEKLLKTVLDNNPGLTREKLAVELGYNEGYISQMLSRNSISEKFVNQLHLKFAKSNPVIPGDRYREDLINALKKHNEFLERIVETNLTQLATTQQIILAQVKAGLQWEAHLVGKDDPKKVESVLGEINKLVAVQMGINVEMDTNILAGI